MKIYCARNSVHTETDLRISDGVNRLLSYYHIKETQKGFGYHLWKSAIKGETKMLDLFLDSGAFSAFTQGIKIDIQEYISFIKEHKDAISVYANLDVIGKNKDSARQTYQNQKIMEKAGLNPLPVFHLHEPFKYLQRYCNTYKYISLGAMVGSSSVVLIPWLDRCFSEYICDPSGIPKIKVHGFGMTSLKLMLRYPWYSVDSTSWVLTGRLGGVYVPRYAQGKWFYDANSWKIQVSVRSPSKKEAGKHISTLSKGKKRIVLDYFKHKGYQVGKSEFHTESDNYELKDAERWFGKACDGEREVETIIEPGLCNIYQQRDELNVIYFKDLENSMPKWPWPYKPLNTIGQLL